MPIGINQQIEAAGNPQLAEDRPEVMAYGRLTDEEAPGDLSISEPLADEVKIEQDNVGLLAGGGLTVPVERFQGIWPHRSLLSIKFLACLQLTYALSYR